MSNECMVIKKHTKLRCWSFGVSFVYTSIVYQLTGQAPAISQAQSSNFISVFGLARVRDKKVFSFVWRTVGKHYNNNIEQIGMQAVGLPQIGTQAVGLA